MTQQEWIGACEKSMAALINILGGVYDRSYNLHPKGKHRYYMNSKYKEYTKANRGRDKEAKFYRPRFEEISNAFDSSLVPNIYVRPDCSGFINMALQVVGAVPVGKEYSVNFNKKDIPGFFRCEPVQARNAEELKNEVINSDPGTIFMHSHHCTINAGGGMSYDFGGDRKTVKTPYHKSGYTHKLIPSYSNQTSGPRVENQTDSSTFNYGGGGSSSDVSSNELSNDVGGGGSSSGGGGGSSSSSSSAQKHFKYDKNNASMKSAMGKLFGFSDDKINGNSVNENRLRSIVNEEIIKMLNNKK